MVVEVVATPSQSSETAAWTAPTSMTAPTPGISSSTTSATSLSAMAAPSGPAVAATSITAAPTSGDAGTGTRTSLASTGSVPAEKAITLGRPSSGNTSVPSRSTSVDNPRASAMEAVGSWALAGAATASSRTHRMAAARRDTMCFLGG